MQFPLRDPLLSALPRHAFAAALLRAQLGQVPMLIAQLAEAVLDKADVCAALAELVARKQAGEELAVAPPVEALTRFIEAERGSKRSTSPTMPPAKWRS